MSNPYTPSPIAGEALDEFVRQLFVCHWVLAQMIAGLVERARSEQLGADQEPADAYALIRGAIGEVARRHGSQQIEGSTRLIDEVMNAISDDNQLFPVDPTVTTPFAHRDSRRSRVRKRRL